MEGDTTVLTKQIRKVTPFGMKAIKHLIRDKDSEYDIHFANVAAGANIDVITTRYYTPKVNAICERFIGSEVPVATCSREPYFGHSETISF